MIPTGLSGPFQLTITGIDSALTGTGIGTYVLGNVNDKDVFIVCYVGRSDNDLKGRLYDHIGDYESFKCGFFDTTLEAYSKECQIYHSFNNLDNKIHPDSPNDTNYTCPVCGA